MFSVSMSHFSFFRLMTSGVVLVSLGTSAAQQVEYSSVHRNGQRALPQTLAGGTAALRGRLAVGRSGISLAVADFDRDGTPDLVTGYALGDGGALTMQRGSPAATAPSPSDWAAIERGELVAPFAAAATAIALPVRPDFLKAVDLDGNGAIDVVVAARGDSSAYVLLGDGNGGFSAARAIPAGGAITALAVWRGPEGANYVVAGVCSGPGSCALEVLAGDGAGRSSITLPGAAGAIEIASLNGGRFPDLAVAAGGSVVLVDGESVLGGAPHMETLPAGGALALAAGDFVYDRRGYPQLAVLGADATLHVLVRAGIDSSAATAEEAVAKRRAMRLNPQAQVGRVKLTGMAWSEPETLLNVGPGAGGGDAPVMFRARLSGGGYDDLAVLAGGQFVTVAHPATFKDGTGKTTPVLTIDSSSSPIVAAVAARMSPDARQGVVFADRGAQPNITLLPTNKTFTVTTTVDGTHSGTTCTGGATCSLRDAIALANNDSIANGQTKVDTINVPAGTFSFSTAFHPANDSGGNINYHFDLDASMNIVGAGPGSTILNGATLDKIFSGDSGIVNGLAPFDIFITGLTMENGTNNNPVTASDPFGGLMDWESFGPGNLTINNVIMTNGTALNSPGGALFTSNSNDASTSASEGLVEIDNSTISGSQSPEQGGGVFLGSGCPALFNTDTLSGNEAVTSVNSSDAAKDGSGGAIYSFGSQATGLTTITNSVLTGNTATDSGGGAGITGGLSISGSSFTGNTAGGFGGGLYYIGGSAGGTITSSTFTGNALAGSSGQTYGGVYQIDGGGICNQSYGTTAGTQFGALTMHYSRIHGNTGGHATGLGIGCSSAANQYSTVNATDNWWGCNGPAAGTGCDTALAASASTQTLSLTPYSTLTISLSSATPAGGSTFTATGSLGQDSSSTLYSTAQDAALSGVAATLAIVQNGGGTTNSTATALSSNAIIATTATASAAGAGTATVTVDGTAVSVPFTVTVPDMTVTSSHTGNFIAGSTGDIYTLTATNSGNAPTTAAVTVVDTVPSGFTATGLTGGSSWSCTLATLTCTNSSVVGAGASFPAITLTVSVASGVLGPLNNVVTVSGGGESNTANDSYSDTTIVVGPPALVETIAPSATAINVAAAVTFQISNPNGTVSLTGVGFSDTLPSNLNVATPNGLTGSCGGGTITATANSGSISLSGATLATNCSFSVNVITPIAGVYTNVTSAVTSTNGGSGSTGSAVLTVLAAPTVGLAFGASTIVQNAATSLSFTVTNPNGTAGLSGVAMSASLPAGLVVATPNGVSGSCGGGAITATAGAGSISLSGATLAAAGSCTFAANVTATTTGTKTVNASASATTAGTGTAGSANLTVILPATHLGFGVAPPTPLVAGGNAGTVTVQELNSSSGIVTTASDTILLTVTGPNSYAASYSAQASSGVASFNLSAVPLQSAGVYTYTATSSPLTSALATEAVNPGTAVGFKVAGTASFAAPGIVESVTVTAIDGFGNTATGFTGAVALTSSDTQAILPASYTFLSSDNGVHVFSLTLETAGTQSITAAGGGLTGIETGIVVSDSIWLVNANGTLDRLTDAGGPTFTAGSSSAASTQTALAFDSIGDVWAVGNATGSVWEFSRTGTSLPVPGSAAAGVNTPTAIGIDGMGRVWVANGNNSVSVLSSAGAAVTPGTGYKGGNMNVPSGLAIDSSGSVWISNNGNDSVTKIIGGAAPVTAPIVTGTTNNTLGTRP